MDEAKVKKAHDVALACAREASVTDNLERTVYSSVFNALLHEPWTYPFATATGIDVMRQHESPPEQTER